MKGFVPMVLALSFLSLLVVSPVRGMSDQPEQSFPVITNSYSPPGDDSGGSSSAHFTCVVSSGAAFFSASFRCIPIGAADVYMFNWTVNGAFASDQPVLNYTVTSAGAGSVSYVVRLQTYTRSLAPRPSLADDFSFTVTVDYGYNLLLYVPVLVISAVVAGGYVLGRLRRYSR